MARIARVVLPGFPHHVTQRGSRRQAVFFCDDDYRDYLNLVRRFCDGVGTACWAYCLMPNHVHLVLVPEIEDGLRGAVAEANRRHSLLVNKRHDWRGHLWQERFYSFPMDETHLTAAVRYIELNPVRAGIAGCAQDWPWSSARAHLAGRDDALVSVRPMLEMTRDWRAYLGQRPAEETGELISRHSLSGRPLGGQGFIARAETLTGRRLLPGKPGRRPATAK